MPAALQTTDVLLEDESDVERAAQMWESFARQTVSVEQESSVALEFARQVASANEAIAEQLRMHENLARRFTLHPIHQYYSTLEYSMEAHSSAIRALQDTALQSAIASTNQAIATTTEGEFSMTQQEREMLVKSRKLSAEKQKEHREWLDAALLASRNEGFIQAVASMSDEVFANLWDNSVDAEYDKL
jgi:hypothetical protein